MPPSATSAPALAQASSKLLARYKASRGDSFSWAKGSDHEISVTSPMSTCVLVGTCIAAMSAIVQADCPTMAEFRFSS